MEMEGQKLLKEGFMEEYTGKENWKKIALDAFHQLMLTVHFKILRNH